MNYIIPHLFLSFIGGTYLLIEKLNDCINIIKKYRIAYINDKNSINKNNNKNLNANIKFSENLIFNYDKYEN